MIRRVVLDTNVLVSSLIFTGGRGAWLRHAWQHGQLTPVACRQTLSELARVLAYPKFKLAEAERDDLLADFVPYAELVAVSKPWPELPECRIPVDQIFPALTAMADCDALITGDDDLLALNAETDGAIMTPAQLRTARPDIQPIA